MLCRLDESEPAAHKPSLDHGEHVKAIFVATDTANATVDGWAADGAFGVEPFVQEGPFDFAKEARGDDILAGSEAGPEIWVFRCEFSE